MYQTTYHRASSVDEAASLFGKKLRIPVLLAPVGSLESFEPGGGATVAKAAAPAAPISNVFICVLLSIR